MSIGALNTISVDSNAIDAGDPNPSVDTTILTRDLGEFNSHPLNTIAVDGSGFIWSMLSQDTVEFTQQVGAKISGQIIKFAQTVGTGIALSAGQILKFIQRVQSYPAGQVIKFAQEVGKSTQYSAYGFDTLVLINNVAIDPSALRGDITITKESNQNTLCTFKLGSTAPYDLLYDIDGGDVIINYRDSFGWHRVFTGVVDVPDVDLINKVITINCSDRRDELILNQISPYLPTIGRYAVAVQGTINNVSAALQYRLQTIPTDVDFDSYNTPNITSWYPKVTPDFTLGSNQVYYRNPKITWQSRTNIINNIIINVKYTYTRLYHYQLQFSWTTPLNVIAAGYSTFTTVVNGAVVEGNSFGGVLWTLGLGPASHPTLATVKQAIASAKWKEFNTLTYGSNYADYGLFSFQNGVAWNTLNDTVASVKDPTPSNPGRVSVTLTAPNPVDATRLLSASWQGSTRFSQNVEEDYTVTVKSTQSIDQFGQIPSDAQAVAPTNYQTSAPFDSTAWDNYSDTSTPDDAVYSNNSFWVNKDDVPLPITTPMFTANGSLAEFNNTMLTAIDKAKTDIIKSHRDTKVSLEVPIMPTLELRHTMAINSSMVVCQGKVSKIVHTINLLNKKGHTTLVEIALFRSRGSAITTETIMPDRPSDSPVLPSAPVVLGNHYGQDPTTTTGSDSWNGFIGNGAYPLTSSLIKTTFSEKFVVDTPAVPVYLTTNRILTGTETYETSLPNDTLDIIFT